jgi:hypothetical protein
MAGVSLPLASTGRRIVRTVALTLALGAAVAAGVLASAGETATVPVAAKAGCVEEVATMRRNHMDLLQRHRDRTVQDGIRTTRHSLTGCVNCHADKETGSVIGRNAAGQEGFCAGCHRFVAVSPDCFDCHASQRSSAFAAATGSSQ